MNSCYAIVESLLLLMLFSPDTVVDVFPSLVNVFLSLVADVFPESSQCLPKSLSRVIDVLRMTFIKRHLHAGKHYKRDQVEGQQKLSRDHYQSRWSVYL